MGKYSCRCSPSFYLETTFILNFYQWFSRNSIFKSKTFCQWHFLIFCSAWSDNFWIPNGINDDLKKIEAWAHQWEMSFNPDPLKQEKEVIFWLKRNKPHHPNTIFNGNPVKKLLPNLILMYILKEYLMKLGNPLVLFASSEIFYRDHLFYKSVNLLLDFT